jgi:hypothetical protein
MAQGAIFFTSYDVLKRILGSTEPQDRGQGQQQQQKDNSKLEDPSPVCAVAEA